MLWCELEPCRWSLRLDQGGKLPYLECSLFWNQQFVLHPNASMLQRWYWRRRETPTIWSMDFVCLYKRQMNCKFEDSNSHVYVFQLCTCGHVLIHGPHPSHYSTLKNNKVTAYPNFYVQLNDLWYVWVSLISTHRGWTSYMLNEFSKDNKRSCACSPILLLTPQMTNCNYHALCVCNKLKAMVCGATELYAATKRYEILIIKL